MSDLSQFYATFFEESIELLSDMETTLMELEPGPCDNETINRIFRAAHSIKGGSATFSFTHITEFTHIAETFLDEVREGTRELTQSDIDLLLSSVDCVRDMIDSLQQGEEIDDTNKKILYKQYEELLGKEGGAVAEEVTADADDDDDDDIDLEALFDSIASGESEEEESSVDEWEIEFIPSENIFSTGNEPSRIFRELAAFGEVDTVCKTDKIPEFSDYNPELCYLSWVFNIKGETSVEAIKEVFDWVIDESTLNIKKKSSAMQAPQENTEPAIQAKSTPEVATIPESVAKAPEVTAEKEPAKAKPVAKKAKAAESASIRVTTDKIDALINMVGELVITQSMLGQIGKNFDVGKLQSLQEGLVQLEQNSRELQECVMKIRMLPVSFVFNRYPRMVRDLANTLNKKINFRLSGENTEIDKSVLEKLGDPLVHLIRNAVDHGIEPGEDRIAAGKPETGEVQVNAYHQGGNVVIEIVDDGKGLAKEMLLNKAIKNGIIGENDVLTEEETFALVFQPGFSTAEVVSDVSGRGVGMDVVYKNITSLGGRVEIKSVVGEGSTFKICLPLTLAILDGQLVRCGSEIFIISLVSIVESIKINMERVHDVAGQNRLYRLREELIPIYELTSFAESADEEKGISDKFLVIVELDKQAYGLVVDELLSQQQVVIKNLEDNYQKINGISGATILGDGTVALIMDSHEIIKSFSDEAKALKAANDSNNTEVA